MSAHLFSDEAEQRLAARLGVEYLFRTLTILGDLVGGDLVDALIVFATLQANTAQLHSTSAAPPVGAPPDDLRRPLSAYSLSMMLNMPYETVRRRLVRLTERGWIVRVRKGMIVPAAKVSGGAIDDALSAHWANLRRLVAAVERHNLFPSPPPVERG